jgi:hypothetical protein
MAAPPTRNAPDRSHTSDNVVFLDHYRALEGSCHLGRQSHRTMRNLIDQMVEGLSDRISPLRSPDPDLAVRRKRRTDSIVLFRRAANQAHETRYQGTR